MQGMIQRSFKPCEAEARTVDLTVRCRRACRRGIFLFPKCEVKTMDADNGNGANPGRSTPPHRSGAMPASVAAAG